MEELVSFVTDEKLSIDPIEILHAMPAELVIFDDKHRYVFVSNTAIINPEVRQWIIGKTDYDYCRKKGFDISIADKRRELFNKVLKSKTIDSIEEVIERDGKTFYAIRMMKPIFDEVGNLKCVIGYGLSVNRYKKFEEHLLQREAAMDAASDGIALCDPNGNYIYMNDSHARIFGYERGTELLGKSWTTIYPPEEAERISSFVFEQLAKDGQWSGYTLGKKKNGELIDQFISLIPLKNGNLICVCRDNSAELNLSDAQTKLINIINNMRASVVVVDIHGKIEMVNDHLKKDWGLKDNQIKQDMLLWNLFPDYRDKILDLLSQIKKTTEPINEIPITIQKNGKEVHYIVDMFSLKDRRNVVTNYALIAHDVTEQVSARREAENNFLREKQLSDLKTQFISTASHELRTPLASISFSLDILQILQMKGALDQGDLMNEIQNIRTDLGKLTETLNDFLSINKVDNGLQSVVRKAIELNDFVNKLLSKNFNVNEFARLRIKIPSNCSIETDPKLFAVVLTNLVSNALKYSKGEVEVKFQTKRNLIIFSVKDNGVGIPEEELTLIFDKFFRSSTAVDIHGIGLGLYITKSFVELLSGTITVNSKHGLGTVFTVSLPKL